HARLGGGQPSNGGDAEVEGLPPPVCIRTRFAALRSPRARADAAGGTRIRLAVGVPVTGCLRKNPAIRGPSRRWRRTRPRIRGRSHAMRIPVALTIAAVVLALPVAVRLAAQTRTAGTQTSDRTWTAHTLWGDPDLQGEWTSEGEYGVPLERP